MSLHEILPEFSNFFTEHQTLGILLSGFIAFIESLAIIGSIVPGSVVMTIVGFMLGAGIIPFQLTLISIFIGAFIGDFISYALGVYFKDYITEHKWVQPYQHWLQHGEAFMRKHGALSIIIGRFVGPMRSMIPMIAGIAHMNLIVFTITIIPTIILWAIVYLTPGVLLGSLSIDMGESLFSTMMYRSLIIIAVFAAWHSLYSFVRIIHSSLQHHTKFILLAPEPLTHLIKAILILGMLIYFLLTQLQIPVAENWYNIAGYSFALSQTTAYEVGLAKFMTILASPAAYIAYNIAIIFVLYYHRHHKVAAYWLAGSLSLFAFIAIMKMSVVSPRPHPLLHPDSFPSGRVLLSGTLVLCLSSLVQKSLPTAGYALRRLGFIFIAVLSLSRIILQAHWVTDITCSYLLAFGIWHSFAAFQHKIPTIPSQHIKQIGASLTLMILPIIALANRWPSLPEPVLPAALSVDSMKDLASLPITRSSRFGEIVAPLNIIWAGPLPEVISTFENAGWVQHAMDKSILERLHTLVMFNDYHAVLPLMPELLNNRVPDLIFGKTTDDLAYIVKFWKTAGKKPIYIGTISVETYPESFFTTKLFNCQNNRYNISNIDMPSRFNIVKYNQVTLEKTINAFCWDGEQAILMG